MSLTWIWPLDGPDGWDDVDALVAEDAGVFLPFVWGTEEPEEEDEAFEPGCLVF